jgi:hypothetical protein
MYLTNKYHQYYFIIINRAKSRNLPADTYTEKHHILPKSLGGNESISNLVKLTAREHFICHVLLTKFTTGNDRHKMISAVIGMKRSRSYQIRYINSRLYESIKIEWAKISSIMNTGKKHSDETRVKMSDSGKGRLKTKEHKLKISLANKGKPKPPMSEELKKQISDKLRGRPSAKKGKIGIYKHSEETKAKIIESNKNRVYSQETKDKISAGVKAANLLKKKK